MLQYKDYKLKFTMTDIKNSIEIVENWNREEELGGSYEFRLKEQIKENSDQADDLYGW